MTKPKKEVKKIEKKKVVPTDRVAAAEPVAPEPKPLPIFDGAQVLEIIGEKGDAYHCKLDNGTTAYVSKELFEE